MASGSKQSFALGVPVGAWLLVSVVLSGMLMAWCLHGARPYLPFVVLIPVFVAIRVCSPLRAALCGAAWGLGLTAASLCLNPSIPLTPATFLTLTALPAAYVGLGSLLTRRIGFSPYVLAVGWMVLKLALSPVLRLFPDDIIDPRWSVWLGSLTAPLLVGFVAAFINAELLKLAEYCLYRCLGCLHAYCGYLYKPFIDSYQTLVVASNLQPNRARAPPAGCSCATIGFYETGLST